MKTFRNHIEPFIVAAMLLALAWSNPLLAQNVKVDSADPNYAEQNTLSLPVTIRGQGFIDVTDVRFFRPGQTSSDPDIEVLAIEDPPDDTETIIATIRVYPNAAVDDYNIEVMLRNGRKGKGTTRLFSVRERDIVYACDQVFDLPDDANCNCWFKRVYEVDSGSPPAIAWKLTNHCSTDTTLVIPWFTRLTMNGEYSITAVNKPNNNPFDGSAVFAVEGHRAEITESNIIIDSDVVSGCGDGELNSVFQLLLDNGSPNPFEDVPEWWDEERWWSWKSYPNTWWTLRGNTITAPVELRLCHIAEVGHTPGQYDYDIVERIDVGGMTTVVAYQNAAIWLHDLGPTPRRSMLVADNVIAPASPTPEDSVAIAIAPFAGEAEVKNNEITLNNGTAILLYGGTEALSGAVHHNDVMGGSRGVVVGNVPTLTVSSNTLYGDGSKDSEGVCSEADKNRIRSNNIDNYETTELNVDCF